MQVDHDDVGLSRRPLAWRSTGRPGAPRRRGVGSRGPPPTSPRGSTRAGPVTRAGGGRPGSDGGSSQHPPQPGRQARLVGGTRAAADTRAATGGRRPAVVGHQLGQPLDAHVVARPMSTAHRNRRRVALEEQQVLVASWSCSAQVAVATTTACRPGSWDEVAEGLAGAGARPTTSAGQTRPSATAVAISTWPGRASPPPGSAATTRASASATAERVTPGDGSPPTRGPGAAGAADGGPVGGRRPAVT